jgi:nicotinate-nucleotide--dimethylbenzimidazole phosphoribosyltransferase
VVKPEQGDQYCPAPDSFDFPCTVTCPHFRVAHRGVDTIFERIGIALSLEERLSMISPRIRRLAENIRPLFGDQAAQSLSGFWAALPKAAGSLGRLEYAAKHVALVRETTLPAADRLGLYVFCGDHGICAEPVGAEGSAATRRELVSFLRGDLPAAALAREYGIDRIVVDCGLSGEPEQATQIYRACDGALNFAVTAALNDEQLNAALEVGASLASEAARRYDFVAISQLGSGGRVSASAVLGAVTGRTPDQVTFVDDLGDAELVAARRNTVQLALARHQLDTLSPLSAVRCLGGAELAAMTGFILAAAGERLPVFADGFCAAVAALIARSIAPDSLDVVLFPGCSTDAAWLNALATLDVMPLLQVEATEGAGFHAVLAMHLVAGILKCGRILAAGVVARRADEPETGPRP